MAGAAVKTTRHVETLVQPVTFAFDDVRQGLVVGMSEGADEDQKRLGSEFLEELQQLDDALGAVRSRQNHRRHGGVEDVGGDEQVDELLVDVKVVNERRRRVTDDVDVATVEQHVIDVCTIYLFRFRFYV